MLADHPEVPMRAFSFGSNLHPDRQTTLFREVGKALLLDHSLAFTRFSKTWDGGTLDVRPLLGSVVHGVVAEVDDIEALDKQEGAPSAYHRVTLPVTLDDGRVEEVAVYIVSKPDSFVAPAEKYLAVVREAYGLHGFPAAALETAVRGETPPLLHNSLFVYGTLMSGESRNRLLGGRPAWPARCRGTLRDLGAYPGLVEGKSWVQGEIVEVENADDMDKLLRQLDEVEGFLGQGVDGSMYERVLIDVDIGSLERRSSWTYRWLGEPGKRIRSGSWRTRLHPRTDPLALLAAEVEGLPDHPVDPIVPGTVAESWWWGADIVVTAGVPPGPDTDGHLRVCTPHARALGLFLNRIRDEVWRGSAFEKLAFYGMIGEAVNELHAENPGASERATMRVVIAAARGMLEGG